MLREIENLIRRYKLEMRMSQSEGNVEKFLESHKKVIHYENKLEIVKSGKGF